MTMNALFVIIAFFCGFTLGLFTMAVLAARETTNVPLNRRDES